MATGIKSLEARDGTAAPALRQRFALHPDLFGVVDRITGYRENGRALKDQVEMAALVVPVILNFGGPFEIALQRAPHPDERYGSFTSGLFPGHVRINSTGDAECVQIDFTPLGAFRFLNLPLYEISGTLVHLSDLADRKLDALRRRLADEPDWESRLDLVEAFVRRRIGSADKSDPATDWAYETILRRQGKLRIADLATALGWSRKHLAQRFRERIGIGPKAVARMVRFNRALTLACGGGSLAEIAFDCGYADQAHLTREFTEFAGTPPQALRAGVA